MREYWAKLQNKNPSMSLVFIGSHGERSELPNLEMLNGVKTEKTFYG